MRLIDALIQYPTTPIFGRIEGLESDTDDKRDWEVEPIDAQVLKESEVSQFYIIKAMIRIRLMNGTLIHLTILSFGGLLYLLQIGLLIVQYSKS